MKSEQDKYNVACRKSIPNMLHKQSGDREPSLIQKLRKLRAEALKKITEDLESDLQQEDTLSAKNESKDKRTT